VRNRGDRVPSLVRVTVVGMVVGLALALTGCGALGGNNDATTTSGAPVPQVGGQRSSLAAPEASKDAAAGFGGAPAGAGADASQIPQTQRLVIRTKTMRVEVKAVDTAIDAIRSLAKRDGADITNMQVATSSDEQVYRPAVEGEPQAPAGATLQAYVTVRVPADKYQAFIDDAAKLGTVLWQGENTDDVTQQHVDLSARLANLRAEEARLREFFAKAKNVTEMLQVEAELSRVRGEIESMAAQVAYLERQAAMATVTIELTEPKPLVRPTGIDWGVGTAFTNSVRAFVGTLNVLIVIIGPVLAVGIFVALPLFLLVRFLIRRHNRRVSAQPTPSDEGRA